MCSTTYTPLVAISTPYTTNFRLGLQWTLTGDLGLQWTLGVGRHEPVFVEPRIVFWGQLGRCRHHDDEDVGHQDDCRWAEPAAAADQYSIC